MVGEAGIKTGLDLALAERDAAGDGQAELFTDADDAPLPLAPVRRSAGRPAGARNRSTEEWRRHLLSRYASPLVGLLEMAARDVRALAEELELWARDPAGAVLRDEHGKPLLAPGALMDALRLQKSALEATLPYLHQKQPMAVEAVGDGLRGGQMIIQIGQVDGGSDGGALPFVELEQDQQVSAVAQVRSDDGVSE